MLNTFFNGLFDSTSIQVIAVSDFLLCVGCALLAGLILAIGYRYKTHCSETFLGTLAILPVIVCVVIMMVNGNIGTGVAVAGAFSLVRFRSAPGTAKEIGAIFTAMGVGLICGMGYLGYALLFTVLICVINLIYGTVGFGTDKNHTGERIFRITIPEDLNYTEVFDELFEKYASACRLVQVKTVNMGSMFRLTYDVTLRRPEEEKELIDELRCRNGNLEIMASDREFSVTEL